MTPREKMMAALFLFFLLFVIQLWPRLICVQLNVFFFPRSSVSDPKADYIGTEPWKPKEALDDGDGGEITDKADIFAYGLTLWEMMTLSIPHLEMLDDDDDDEEG